MNTLQQEVISHFSSVESYINRLATGLAVVQQQNQSEAVGSLDSLRQMEANLREISAAATRIQSNDLQSKIMDLKRIFDEKNETFFRLQKEQQSHNEFLRKQRHLRRQIEHMEKLQQDLEAAQRFEQDLLKERQILRAQMEEFDNQIWLMCSQYALTRDRRTSVGSDRV